MVAAVLHLDEGARPALDGVDHVAGGLAHREDVVDARLLGVVDAEIRQRAIGVRLQLLLIAEHEVDLVHGDEILRLGLRGAAGDDDAGGRVFAAGLADRLLGLAHGLAGDGAGVEDDGAAFERAEAGAFGLAPHHLGFIGVEAAAEGDDVDALGAERPSGRAFGVAGPGAGRRIEAAGKFPFGRHRSG